MNTYKNIFIAATLMFGGVFFHDSVYATTEKAITENAIYPAVDIHYNKGLISLQVNATSLMTILLALHEKTGINIVVEDATIRSTKISSNIKESSLYETLSILLKSFSYVIDLGHQPTLYVLSALPNPLQTTLMTSDTPIQAKNKKAIHAENEDPSDEVIEDDIYLDEDEPDIIDTEKVFSGDYTSIQDM